MILSVIGLVLLSKTTGAAPVGSAVIFAAGLCFTWPTMLGFEAEYLPKTGAMGLSLTSGVGMLSVALVVPMMGKWYDDFRNTALASGATVATAKYTAGVDTFLKVAIMPAIVLVIMVAVYIARRKVYTAEKKLKLMW